MIEPVGGQRGDTFSGGEKSEWDALEKPTMLQSIALDHLQGKSLEASISNHVPWGFRWLAELYIGSLDKKTLTGPSLSGNRDVMAFAILKAAGKSESEAKGLINDYRLDAQIKEASQANKSFEEIYRVCLEIFQIAVDISTLESSKEKAIEFLTQQNKSNDWPDQQSESINYMIKYLAGGEDGVQRGE